MTNTTIKMKRDKVAFRVEIEVYGMPTTYGSDAVNILIDNLQRRLEGIQERFVNEYGLQAMVTDVKVKRMKR
jgi:hypothetical protein